MSDGLVVSICEHLRRGRLRHVCGRCRVQFIVLRWGVHCERREQLPRWFHSPKRQPVRDRNVLHRRRRGAD